MKGTIRTITDLGDNLKRFIISLDQPFSYAAGQYVMLWFPDDPKEKRAFSIVSFDIMTWEMSFIIRRVGAFTSRMFSAKEGDGMILAGPYGRFILPEKEKPLVFIGGGVGITPLYSMLCHIKESGYDRNAYLFYSAKMKEEMVLLDDILGLRDERIHINLFFTKEEVANYRFGRVNCDAVRDSVPEFDESLFYICGPKAMIDDFRTGLQEYDVPDYAIMSEEFH